ncbi:ribosome-associated GTPase [Novosphingobium sp. Rr 2-17]|uniref:ribosome small subunit-dependent GTPase A n=1 Tax=Novosphingobium sp. Rr 2-17 TaxID=555793 RepID=UPI000269955E|nr:ribosome small subunit-dependent GTPase A [Novosphingobium sp. Rr 2-17]EIZ78049.1 ribosome-associated GTPase [Novosphingobium sp. Rr 2-17]
MNATHETLEDLGWKAHFSEQVSDEEAQQCQPVRVMAVHRGQIAVAGAGPQRFITPYISGAKPSDDHPTVGDWLLIDRDTLQPVRVLQRMNLFKRRAVADARKEQMIAANVETLFIVASCNQDFSVARLERYLVLAREVGVHPVVVLTKTDLIDDPETFADAARALEPGLRVETVNGRDPTSAARLAAWCGVGETVALLGSSGVGKSTLVNTLRGSNSIATQAVREADGKGRHTTTVREMHRLDQGGWLLDTPGMRELQLSDAASGISEVFDDFILTAQSCRFSNCGHGGEPGCAVRAAIADGTLTSLRFDRWRKLTAEESANAGQFGRRSR